MLSRLHVKSLSVFVVVLTTVATAGAAAAAPTDSQWNTQIDAGLASTQAAYSDNWVGGEIGSFNWTYTSSVKLTRALSTKMENTTQLRLAYGQTYSQQRDADGSTRWLSPQKSTDLIDLESVMRFTLNGYVDPYLATRVESQFFDASFPSVKRYLNPVRFTESGGILRVFSANPKVFEFKSRLGFALRQFVDRAIDDTVLGSTHRVTTTDGGVESVTDLTAALGQRATYTSKLTLFKALFFSESESALNDDWKAADANWEHVIAASFTNFLQATLYFQFLYDKQIDKGVRIKETLGLGLSYKFRG